MTWLFIDAVFPSRKAFPGCTPVGLPLVPCAVVTWEFPPDKSTAGDQYLLASLTIKFAKQQGQTWFPLPWIPRQPRAHSPHDGDGRTGARPVPLPQGTDKKV